MMWSSAGDDGQFYCEEYVILASVFTANSCKLIITIFDDSANAMTTAAAPSLSRITEKTPYNQPACTLVLLHPSTDKGSICRSDPQPNAYASLIPRPPRYHTICPAPYHRCAWKGFNKKKTRYTGYTHIMKTYSLKSKKYF